MQGQRVGFDSSYRRYLDAEQRRAVLEAIGGTINPDSTLGEVIDAAEALGWSEQMGDLSLADLADALLAPEAEDDDAEHQPEPETATALAASDDDDEYDDEDEDETDDYVYEDVEDDEDEDEEDDDQLALVELPPRARRGSTKKKATKKKAASSKSTKKATKKKAAASSKSRSKKKATKKKAASSKKKAAKRTSKIEAVDIDDRMSLDQAAEFFLPYVEDLGEATMQALEEDTGVARRKLRFHVGQLVRNGYLERHGMGRGTYYTVCE